MPSSPSRPAAAEEASDADMPDGEVPPRQAAEAVGGGAANRAAPDSAGEEDEEIYDDVDGESSDDSSYDDDESGESEEIYDDEDGEEEEEEEEEEEQEGAGGGRASGSAEEEAASAGVGGGPKAEGAAATCCICMDPWTSSGAHRICCIPCGHVYGRSCLERWLLRCGNTSAKCPQCGRRFKHRHIINLYSTVHLWNDFCYKEAYKSFVEHRNLEVREYLQRVKANGDYDRQMMAAIWSSMQTRTDLPPMGPPPPPSGDLPHVPTFDEWVALGSETPGTGASSVFSTGVGGSTPASESPVTPIWQGGAGLGGAHGDDPRLG